MSELISRFRAEYIKTKKSLGQHFLTNRHFVEEIAQHTVVNDDAVIEIGPGCGVLTEELAKLTDKLTVIDIDDNSIAFLREHKDEFFPKIEIVHSDVMQVDFNLIYQDKIAIVGNLPYNMSVRIVEHCTKYINNISRMVFMFQKEVAHRIAASEGGKEYSSLSVYCNYNYNIKKVREISGSNFWPNANVMSTVLVFTPKANRPVPKELEEKFYRFILDSFKQKRKTLHNNLRQYTALQSALATLELQSSVRAEQISGELFVKLFLLLQGDVDAV